MWRIITSASHVPSVCVVTPGLSGLLYGIAGSDDAPEHSPQPAETVKV
jgi:hypothetical protein